MNDNLGNKIIGIITARGGSKGLPGKNIKLLGGKPLIAYTIETALECSFLSDVIVSTDDRLIANIARQYGANVPFIRPKELATDTAGHFEVIEHALKFMENKKGFTYDYVVIFQPTSPFRTVDDVYLTISKLVENRADSAFSVCEVDPTYHPIKMKRVEKDLLLPYSMEEEIGVRRQDLPIVYKRSGAVYVTKRSLLINKKRLFGDFIVGHVVPKERSIDIDTEVDWMVAEYMYKKLKAEGFWG